MTAVEWLEQKFLKLEATVGVHHVMYEIIQKAKEMESLQPTWKDVEKAIALAQKEEYDESGYLGHTYEPEQIINQLKQSKP